MKMFKIKYKKKEYEVKGCPFCGKKPEITPDFNLISLDCFNEKCGSIGGPIRTYFKAAVNSWNNRKE